MASFPRLDTLRLVVSGEAQLWKIEPDEAMVLRDYQSVRDAGRGSLFIEFVGHQVKAYDVKTGGGTAVLNSLLPGTRRLRE